MEFSIWDLFEDSRGNIWIGTLNHGVFIRDPETGTFSNLTTENGLISSYVPCIEEDPQGRIWLGSESGISVYQPEDESFSVLYSGGGQQHPLSNNHIQTIFRDSKNKMWVGTLDGLNRYNADKNGFDVWRQNEGLSSSFIMSILEDRYGAIWVSTAQGITQITESGEELDFQSYGLSDGLQGEIFTEEAGLRTSDGSLVFSGQNGFNIFKPDDIEVIDRDADLLFTNFYISNQRVSPTRTFNDRILLSQDLNETERIDLYHNENSIAFEFVALSFFQSGKVRYEYMLEGFDADWITSPAGSRRANYTNLPSGEYVFRLRNVYNQGATGEEISIRVRINPPFWETPWAFGLYLLIGAGILYLIRTYIVSREREKSRIHNERREAERQHELDMMKLKFFTNISHELRTPLSLILTPIERMIQNVDNIKTNDLTIIHRNANRLMTLVNQLLDFRKIEANQHVLNESSGDLVTFLQGTVDSFQDLAREKQITLGFHSEVTKFYTSFDKDKMEKVMFNLLSNAFKFTRPDGKVTVSFDVVKREAGKTGIIQVSDTGIGISEEKRELVFNRFFQAETADDLVNNGTGIGLSITKEFVEVHGGKIWVESKLDEGSTFIIELPLNGIADAKPEIETPAEEEADSGLPKVCIVEDNSDFRFYLKDNLKPFYRISEAANGRDALKLIRHELPDLVVSDVMMPIMDGHELCDKIKSDPRTSHIPVILLTAQSSDQHRIEGLEAGAIEYISKPFNFDILVSSINSALKFHERVREAQELIKVSPSEVEIVSLDEQLIARAIEMVEENISNSEFSVENLSKELGYSRGHFYQKILKITGQTPMDFIRNIRMKRAADLLSKSQLNVSEVAYKVGYNNPKLFSRYFKTQYGIYPSEYKSNSEAVVEKEKNHDHAL